MPDTTLTHPTAGTGGTPQTLTLPAGLLWADEYAWQPLTQAKEYTTTGALVIDTWPKQAGRTIRLEGTETRAWCERGTLETLRLWAGQPGQTLTLSYRGQSHAVVFDHDPQPIDASPLSPLLADGPSRYTVTSDTGAVLVDVDVDYFAPLPTDPYQVVFRFIQI
jgi:hypothetical protein